MLSWITLFLLIAIVLWDILLLLLGLWLVHFPAELVHLALEVCLTFLVYSHLKQLLVRLGHAHLSSFHFVRLKWRQVVEKTVLITEDFDACRVELVLWSHIAVRLAKHFAVPVKAPEHLEEPCLICTLLLNDLHESSDGC